MACFRCFVFAVVLTATGCATITRGETEQFEVLSEPPGAIVTFASGLRCTTPCQIELHRNDSFEVTVEKAGYKSLVTRVVPRQAAAGTAGMLGNVVVGPGGIIVDAVSGAMKDLTPNPLRVVLTPVDSVEPSFMEPAGLSASREPGTAAGDP